MTSSTRFVSRLGCALAIMGAAMLASAQAASSKGVTRHISHRGAFSIETYAQGSGPVVVLLASLGRGAEDFDAIAGDLERDGFRVLRPEPRGIGGSNGPMDHATLHDFAADVAAAIEDDPIAREGNLIVAGHAYGSFVARALAMDRPDLVRAVVVISGGTGKSNKTGANGAPPDPARLKIRQAIVDSGNDALPDEERLRALKFVFFAPGNDPRVWLRGWHSDVLESQLRATEATPLEAYYSGGDKPVLDIHAQDDVVSTTADAQRLKNVFGDRIEIVFIPHAGHALVVEQPAAITAAMVKFIRALPTAVRSGSADR